MDIRQQLKLKITISQSQNSSGSGNRLARTLLNSYDWLSLSSLFHTVMLASIFQAFRIKTQYFSISLISSWFYKLLETIFVLKVDDGTSFVISLASTMITFSGWGKVSLGLTPFIHYDPKFRLYEVFYSVQSCWATLRHIGANGIKMLYVNCMLQQFCNAKMLQQWLLLCNMCFWNAT